MSIGVDIDYFFGTILNIEDCDDLMLAGTDNLARIREVLTLARAYYSIDNAEVRQSVFELAKVLADTK